MYQQLYELQPLHRFKKFKTSLVKHFEQKLIEHIITLARGGFCLVVS